MGSIASKTWNDMNDYYFKAKSPSPPPTTDHMINGTKLSVGSDPRSPTFDFDRTPIQVIDRKEGENLSYEEIVSEEVNQLSEQLNQLLDPRSPTQGIDRTPIDFIATNEAIDLKMSAMRLSFESNASDSANNSMDCLVTEEKCNSTTPLSQTNDTKTNESNGGQRVRTPLSSVQQKVTPIRNAIRNRKQLEITKRAHINSHLKKNKAIVPSVPVIDNKENF